MTRYGTQDGAKKGYTPTKKGRPSQHPLITFIADVKLVANMWLRGGNTSSATNFLGFLEDTLSKLKNKTVSLISDCGSFHSFPETSLEENVSFFGCRQGDHAAAKKMVKTNNGKKC